MKRSVAFFEKYGPVTDAVFAFTPQSTACTASVNSGIVDFLTGDGLWDMKLHKAGMRSKDALQVLMYWIMGQHLGQEIFKSITKIGLFNPRRNVAYILDTAKIAPETIRAVEREVICY